MTKDEIIKECEKRPFQVLQIKDNFNNHYLVLQYTKNSWVDDRNVTCAELKIEGLDDESTETVIKSRLIDLKDWYSKLDGSDVDKINWNILKLY